MILFLPDALAGLLCFDGVEPDFLPFPLPGRPPFNKIEILTIMRLDYGMNTYKSIKVHAFYKIDKE